MKTGIKMLKKTITLIIAVLLTVTALAVGSYALEENRDSYANYVQGGQVSSVDDLIAAFTNKDTGKVYAIKDDTRPNTVILNSDVKLRSSIVINDGVYTVLGSGCKIYRGSGFGALFVLNGSSTEVYPSLVLENLTLDGMNDKLNEADHGLVLAFGHSMLQATKVSFENSSSSGESGGAICIKVNETSDYEKTPLYADLVINECTFKSCSSANGGAIASYAVGTVSGGNFVFEKCVFENNKASSTGAYGYGGAISCMTGSFAFKNCTFKNNTADFGGAIYTMSGIKDTSSTFEANSATLDGGAISGTGRVSLESTMIINNTAGKDGGAIALNGDALTKNCYISENSAGGNGGGMYILGTYEMSNGNLNLNTAKGIGGGIYVKGSNAQIKMTDGEIVGNKAEYCGGIYCVGEIRLIGGAIGNSVSEFPQVFVEGKISLGSKAMIKDDIVALSVKDKNAYPFVSVDTTLSDKYILNLAYATPKTDENGEIISFKNVTRNGKCIIVADAKTMERINDAVKIKSRGLLSYKLDGEGVTSVRFVFLPIWAWIIILAVILGVCGFIFRKPIISLVTGKKQKKSKKVIKTKKKDLDSDSSIL